MGPIYKNGKLVSNMIGVVYQWKNSNGQLMQVEMHSPSSTAPTGPNASIYSTLCISLLEQDTHEDPVPGKFNFPQREMEVDGRTGEWVPENLADPGSSTTDNDTINATHIPMGEDVTPDVVDRLGIQVDVVGRRTFDNYACGTPEDMYTNPWLSSFQDSLDQWDE
jgi:hypothetical protein